MADEPRGLETLTLEENMSRPEGTPVRLPLDLLKRADALVPALDAVPELRTWGRVSRAKVVRLALLRGLVMLEAEHAGKVKP